MTAFVVSGLTRHNVPNRALNTITASRRVLNEYHGVLELLHRSGLQDVRQLCRQFSSSSQRPNQNQNDSKKDPNKDEEDGKISNLLAKAFLWMLTAYMLTVFISLMFPSTSQPETVRYVSWNEFIHHMLAKGEVEQIIVRPDVDIVTIILCDGAVIKGKKVSVFLSAACTYL